MIKFYFADDRNRKGPISASVEDLKSALEGWQERLAC
jgi:hypothetical protein